MANGLHGLAVIYLGGFGWMAGFGWRYGAVWVVICLVLGVEAVWGRQPEKRQRALFEANAMVSGLVLGGVVWEIFWK